MSGPRLISAALRHCSRQAGLGGTGARGCRDTRFQHQRATAGYKGRHRGFRKCEASQALVRQRVRARSEVPTATSRDTAEPLNPGRSSGRLATRLPERELQALASVRHVSRRQCSLGDSAAGR